MAYSSWNPRQGHAWLIDRRGQYYPDLLRFYLPLPSAASPELHSTYSRHQESQGGKEALPSDFGVQCLGLAAKGSIAWRLRKPTENCLPPLPKTAMGWQESPALALSQQMSLFSQCRHLKTPLCSTKITLPLTPASHSKETWGVAVPNLFPTWPTTALIFAGYRCENTGTKIKGILLTFKYSIRKSEAHTLHTGSCPMCPDCYHTATKLPSLEWLFQPRRGLLWKELEESLWLLLYAK